MEARDMDAFVLDVLTQYEVNKIAFFVLLYYIKNCKLYKLNIFPFNLMFVFIIRSHSDYNIKVYIK